jgi:hypothetical protein
LSGCRDVELIADSSSGEIWLGHTQMNFGEFGELIEATRLLDSHVTNHILLWANLAPSRNV